MVKRLGDVWNEITSIENLTMAYRNARSGHTHKKDVAIVDSDPLPYLHNIQEMLQSKTYVTSQYHIFEISERGKIRRVADLPFYPDRIIHWALIQIIGPKILSNLIDQTYAALPNRGTHKALSKMKEYLKDPKIEYCLKTDVRHFFPSIDKDVIMSKLERLIKDQDTLWLCSRIIYDYPESGIPIGNYTSQYFANLYLSDIDHLMKEQYHCHYYLRYMDDIIILGYSKEWLHRMRSVMSDKMTDIGLEMKSNWQVFPIEDRGVDFVGYRTFRNYTLLRTQTKIHLKRATKEIISKITAGESLNEHDRGSIASYYGILGYCDSFRLSKSTIAPILEHLRVIS